MRLIQRRPKQIVHRRVHNHESLLAVLLYIQNPRKQRSRLRHDKPPWLQQQLKTLRRLNCRNHSRRILMNFLRRIERPVRVILDSQPAADIDELDRVPVPAQLRNQPDHPPRRGPKRLRGPDLRSDVNADAASLQMFSGPPVDRTRPPDVDAEFVLLHPGRYIRMRIRKHIGIHPQRNPRPLAHFRRPFGQQFQFLFALHIEQKNLRTQRKIHLRRGLANP